MDARGFIFGGNFDQYFWVFIWGGAFSFGAVCVFAFSGDFDRLYYWEYKDGIAFSRSGIYRGGLEGNRIQKVSSVLFLLFSGTVLGVLAISALDKKWLLPLLCFSIFFVEIAPKIASKISKKIFLGGGFLVGIYYGFFGPGIHLLILGMLRTQNPQESEIAKNKMQAIFLETMIGFWAIFMHFSQGHLVARIWICWAAGSLVGGVLGGKILQKVGKMPGETQNLILRISFVIALLAAGATYFDFAN